MTLSTHMRPQGRRIALTALLAVVLAAVFASTALAAPTITYTNAPAFADPAPLQQTENRYDNAVAFTVAGGVAITAVDCATDNGAYTDCSGGLPGNGNFTYSAGPVPFDLGSHEIHVRVTDGVATTKHWTWRVEAKNYSDTLIPSGGSLMGYWKLDDLADAAKADNATGNAAYDGTYNPGAYVVKRQPAGVACELQPHQPFGCAFNTLDSQGWSAYFGGRDDEIDIHNIPKAPNNKWSMEAWVKPDFSNELRGIARFSGSLWTTDNGHFACAQASEEGSYRAISSSSYVPGQWYHVACIRDGYSIKLYVNGVLRGTTTSHADTWSTGYDQAYIGRGGNPSPEIPGNESKDWWKGWIDDVAYYHDSLSADEIYERWRTGTVNEDWYDVHPGVTNDVAPPSSEPITGGTSIQTPQNNSQFSPDAQNYKHPTAAFTCWDPQFSGVQVQILPPNCTATVAFGVNPPVAITNGTPLPLAPGSYTFTLTATDGAGNTWVHSHKYVVTGTGTGFSDLVKCINPSPAAGCSIPLAYYRLNEGSGATTLIDSGPNGFNGEFKNDQNQGGTGISGDSNKTRDFFGLGGYAAVNNIDAPIWGYTIEFWWKPADNGPSSLFQQGSNGAVWYDGGNVKFRADEKADNPSGIASFPLPTPSSTGHWYFVAAVYDGITAKLYVRESTSGNTTLTPPATALVHAHDGYESADTLYLGYGTEAPWLRGALDEVVYWGTPLAATKLEQHFNADPPAGDVEYTPADSNSGGGGSGGGASSGGSSSASASTPVTTAKKPAVTSTASKPAAKKLTAAQKKKALTAAKAKVASLTKSLAKAKAKVKSLKRHHASKKSVKKAQAKVTSLQKQLTKAKAATKKLA